MTKSPLSVWSRREFLGTAIGGAAFVGIGAISPSLGAQNADTRLAGKILNIVLRYRTDAARIARVLPPGLEPDDAAEVMVDWWVRYPVAGSENIYYPGVYSECGIHMTAKYQGHRGMFQVGMPLDQDWGRVRGRENTGLVKKDGVLSVLRQGNQITGELRRRGKLLYRIKTQMRDEPAHPLFWHRETGFGAFLYRYRLNPDWQQGPLGPDPVELWLRVLAGKTGEYPKELTPGGPRACDPAQTVFEFVDPSVLDPFCEFPVRSVVGVGYSETGLGAADAAAYRQRAPRTSDRIERLQMIDKKAFEPWALLNYDRPITKGRAWVPVRWPEKTSALVLSSDELRRYRERPSLELEVTEFVDLQLAIDPAIHARTLPPPLQPGNRPVVRIVAMRVGTNDVSTEPFTELWLLSRCERAGTEAWYALSHIAGAGGDVVYGRETFGYPSKTGTLQWQSTAARSSLLGRRMGRDFVRLGWNGGQRQSAAPAPSALEIIGLRRHPPYRVMTLNGFAEPGAKAELIAQPWSLELTTSAALDQAGCSVKFPETPGPGQVGTTDPWFEFKNGKLIAALTGGGVLRRAPGRTLDAVPNYEPYYADRFEGATTTEFATTRAGEVKHTFLRP